MRSIFILDENNYKLLLQAHSTFLINKSTYPFQKKRFTLIDVVIANLTCISLFAQLCFIWGFTTKKKKKHMWRKKDYRIDTQIYHFFLLAIKIFKCLCNKVNDFLHNCIKCNLLYEKVILNLNHFSLATILKTLIDSWLFKTLIDSWYYANFLIKILLCFGEFEGIWVEVWRSNGEIWKDLEQRRKDFAGILSWRNEFGEIWRIFVEIFAGIFFELKLAKKKQ
jgi:hypothetical protein